LFADGGKVPDQLYFFPSNVNVQLGPLDNAPPLVPDLEQAVKKTTIEKTKINKLYFMIMSNKVLKIKAS
jgi:predicted secreted protein